MTKRESLKHLAYAYLVFLITRDDSAVKPFLSVDFMARLRVSQQLRLIKGLSTALNYGITPEAHIWDEYVTEDRDGVVFISPFQFDVAYRNVMNPLLTETMIVTVNSVFLENGDWKIGSVLNDTDHNLLVNYAAKNRMLEPTAEVESLKIRPT